MDMFSWLPTGFINEIDSVYPDTDITKGVSPLSGMLGQEFQLDDRDAARFSKTSVATEKGGRFKLVRLNPSASAAIASAVRGRPMFWSNRTLHQVSYDYDGTQLFAGVLMEVLTAKGNITMLRTEGEGFGLFAGALTKAVPADGDALTVAVSGGIAAFDVLADATAMTMAFAQDMQNFNSKVAATVTAGAVSLIEILGTLESARPGII